MRPDGTDQRRVTDGGNPFYARFSPDGRCVLYSDNGRGEQSGIWVVEVLLTLVGSWCLLQSFPSTARHK